jgi:DNA-binding response OmpR family regulator
MAGQRTILLYSTQNSGSARLKAVLRRLASNFELETQSPEQIGKADYSKYSLIFVDAINSRDNSFGTCNQIKQYCQQKVPIVMLGEDDSLKTIVEAYKNGADYYVPWHDTGEEAQLSSMKNIIQRATSQFGRVSA